jgi:hypothetical protein
MSNKATPNIKLPQESSINQTMPSIEFDFRSAPPRTCGSVCGEQIYRGTNHENTAMYAIRYIGESADSVTLIVGLGFFAVILMTHTR